ncbi:MAG: hypothetical protein MJZ16_11395 [Bacteroidales bacterium]|nr:hypothetical protein [Bacteroidales bacterium]
MKKRLSLFAVAMLSAVVAFAQPQGGPGGFPGGGQGFGGQRPEGQRPQGQRPEGRQGMREGMPPMAIYQATEEDLASKSIVVYTSYKTKAEASAVLVELLQGQNYTIQAASTSTVLAYKTLAQMQQDAMAEMQAKMQERMGDRPEGERPQGRPEGMPGGFPGGGFPGGGMPPMGGGFPGGGMPPMMMGGGFPGFPGMGGSSTVQENEITAKIGGNASKGITITFKSPKPSKDGNPVYNETGKIAKMIPGTTKVVFLPR